MMYKTQTLRSLSVDRSNVKAKSMGNFVLLNEDREVTQRHQWKPLKTSELILQQTNSLNKKISFGGSYSSKKSLLLTLNLNKKTQTKNPLASKQKKIIKQIQTDILLKSKLNFDFQKKQQTQQNQVKNTQKTFDSIQNKQKMEQRLKKFTNSTTNFNQTVEQSIVNYKLSSLKNRKHSNTSRSAQSQLHHKIKKAYERDQRLIGVITLKRNGLRIQLKHAFAQICICNRLNHLHAHKIENNKKITSLVQSMLSISQFANKHFYYFHLNKEPLTSSSQLATFESVILASQSPVLNLENEFYLSLQEQAQKLQNLIKSTQNQLGVASYNINEQGKIKSIYQSPLARKISLQKKQFQDENNESTQYDWQVITDVDQFVEQIVQNPEHAIIHTLPDFKEKKSIKNQIRSLYNQKFDTQSKIQTGEGFRNPLLEDHSHYHLELKQKPILNAISSKLQEQTFIKNNHIVKRQSIDTLIQRAKQQQQLQQQELQNPNIINRNVTKLLQTKKAVIRQLDEKNSLLFEQNIPFMMEKYRIGRYEIHNLFAIYKTLEKISAMKLHAENKSKKVLEKGIDRFTFDLGMKRLDINPGEEVIKNICYFSDFISWQQFIKIVSIGLRKTPEQKIEAILSGIGGTNKGQLSKNQISIMIGSSLNKIFDSEQTELKEYFTEVVMRDLDADGNGHVDVGEIKKKCLNIPKIMNQEEKMDLVSFLLLNS